MTNLTVGLSHFPLSIKILKFYDHPTCLDISFMMVKICTKKKLKKSSQLSTDFVHILTIMSNASLHVG